MNRLKRLLNRVRAALNVVQRSRQFEREMHDEMRFHVEMEAARLEREDGLDPREARRLAAVRFGGLENYKEAGRDVRGRRWLDALSVDARLGFRRLVKYRGLTLVGGLAMAVAIGIGATAFEVFDELLAPLPFADGERVVSVQGVDPWRQRLTSIEELGAFRTVQHNLVAPPALPEPIRVAEMTASGFSLARIRPLLGRHLLPADEAAGAPPVVVVGYRAWRSRFMADPDIVGRLVNLGGVAHTVVGVMPEGFGFPLNHEYWSPLRGGPEAYARSGSPSMDVFGRLASGVSIEQARAELATIARRSASEAAAGRETARVAVVPYTLYHVDLSDPGVSVLIRIVQLMTGALTFVVAVNLAILFYARTIARTGELAVRTALGASRARLLAQLFIEALSLSLVGAVAGLGLSAMSLEFIGSWAQDAVGAPFWIRFDLSGSTALVAVALAVLAALIMGVVPGLRVTGRRLNANLHELNARASTRLGPIWTTLVVGQVAAAVAVLPAACYLTLQTVLLELSGPGFAADKIVVTRIAIPDENAPGHADRVERRLSEIMRRFEEEHGVSAVTFSSSVPGVAEGAGIEFDGGAAVNSPAPWTVSRLRTAVEMLDVYGAHVIAGRAFVPGDLGAANAVVVNEMFTQWLAGSPLGVRFRYTHHAGQAQPAGPWYEIVGVVGDMPRVPKALNLDTPAVVYHPARLGDINPAILSVRFDGDIPAGFADRARRIGAEVDPALQIRQALTLSDFYRRIYSLWRYLAIGGSLATLSVLVLSAAGMYALMSFTVAQRSREIGIRVALGARPSRLLFSIFGRALRQLALGIALGSFASSLVISASDLGPTLATGLLVAVALTMLAAGLVATIGPARRSLGIHAADALRADS